MMVDDATKFTDFALKIGRMTETEKKNFIKNCMNDYKDIASDDPAKCEKAFLKLIKKEVPGGISLYRKDENTNKFEKLSIDSFGDLSSKNCF